LDAGRAAADRVAMRNLSALVAILVALAQLALDVTILLAFIPLIPLFRSTF
jgi:hypothetical protein